MNLKHYEDLKKMLGDILDNEAEHVHDALNIYLIDTKIGQMIVISNNTSIRLLDFITRKHLIRNILKIKTNARQKLICHKSDLIKNLETELHEYFSGKLRDFTTPISLMGTIFQQKVWTNLQKIPYGKTISYLELAKNSGNEKAVRAVANANANNNIAIVVPCHRVIQSDGRIGGYAGGVIVKEKLLLHEKNNLK